MHLIYFLSFSFYSQLSSTILSSSLSKVEVTGALFFFLAIMLLTLIPKGILIFYATRKSEKKQNQENKEKIGVLPKPRIDPYFEKIRELAKKNDPLFLERFMEVYPDITQQIMKKHPDLLKSELSLCAMIFLNFSSKEIAEYTFIQHRSVQTKKSRLRKKMNLSSSTDLYRYIRSFAA